MNTYSDFILKVIVKIYLFLLQSKGSLAVATHSPKHSSKMEFLGNYSNLHDKSGEQRLSEHSQPIRPERRPECSLNPTSSSPLCSAGQCKSSTWNPQPFTKLWLPVKKSLARVPVGQSWFCRSCGPTIPSYPRWSSSMVRRICVGSLRVHIHWVAGWRLIFSAHFTLYLLTTSDMLDSGQIEGTRASSVHLTSSIVCHLLIGNLQEFI